MSNAFTSKWNEKFLPLQSFERIDVQKSQFCCLLNWYALNSFHPQSIWFDFLNNFVLLILLPYFGTSMKVCLKKDTSNSVGSLMQKGQQKQQSPSKCQVIIHKSLFCSKHVPEKNYTCNFYSLSIIPIFVLYILSLKSTNSFLIYRPRNLNEWNYKGNLSITF